MKSKSLALLMAAALLAGTIPAVMAGEEEPVRDQREYSEEYEPRGRRGDWRGDRDEWRHRRDDRDGWHRGRRYRGDDDDWRGGPRFGHGRGPGFRPDGFGPGFGFHGFGHGMWEEIQLDDAQKAKMIDVMTENFRAGLEAKIAMMDARRKLWDLEKDPNASSEAIIAAHAALGEAEGRMKVLHGKGRDAIKAVLTPEQQQKLDELRKDRPFGRPGDRGPGRPGGRGPGGRGPGGPGPKGRP